MATPLEITYRKAGVEYHEERLSEMEGWNADSTDATLGRDEFSEIRNFRRPTTGDFEVRTGASTNYFIDSAGTELLAKCEYRNDYDAASNGVTVDTFFDVSLFYKPGTGFLVAMLEEKTTNPVPVNPIVVLADPYGSPPAAAAESWIVQYAWSLIVTIKGYGSFEVAPTNATLTTWTVRALGKDVCPTPNGITFIGHVTGDLLVRDNNGGNGGSLATSVKEDPTDPGQPLLIPIPIAADYWLINDTAHAGIGIDAFALNDPPRFVFNNTDVAEKNATQHSFAHNPTRAWGYRFVAVQEFTNSKGEKYRVRSAPSADLWVPDMTYAPAQWGPQPHIFDNPDPSWALDPGGWYDAGASLFIDPSVVPVSNPSPTTNASHFDTNSYCLPSVNDLNKLQHQYRKRNGNDRAFDGTYRADNGPDVNDPYFFLAWYLGFRKRANHPDFAGMAPYLTAVPASQLKQAPLLEVQWSDFTLTGLEGNVIEIEVYRTAHSEPQDKDNTTKDPNFEAHKYGYVGSITPDAIFRDDTVDDAIDFGTTPEQQDGYLRGEFSGAVIREYDNRLVIGDVVTDYKVLPPAALVGSFGPATVRQVYYETADDSPATFYTVADIFDLAHPPTDGLANTVFYAAYVDNNGIQSAATPIAGFVPIETSTAKLYTSFVFPRGYAANVTKVRLYRGVWNPALTPPARDYTLLTELSVESGSGVYISKKEAGTSVQASALAGETKRSTSPGSIIFSEPNQIYFWPPLNFETHHQFAPVRALEVVLGPLYVMTDQSVALTELNGRREELTRHVGPISRFAVQKVDKIVFFLSPFGMYYVESSGVVEFPAQVKTVVMSYLNEEITSVERLTNARRASLGFLGERGELWLHFPSSLDLNGHMPHRTILYKLADNNLPKHVINYEFDLREDFERGDVLNGITAAGYQDDTSKWHSEKVIFLSRAMGGLSAGFYDHTQELLATLDNDRLDLQWTGSEVIEKSWHMGSPGVKKGLRGIVIRTQGFAQLKLSTGQAAPLDATTHTWGRINPAARVFLVNDPTPPLRHIVAGQTLESVATAPYLRVWGEPDPFGRNDLHVKSIDVFATVLNNHP